MIATLAPSAAADDSAQWRQLREQLVSPYRAQRVDARQRLAGLAKEATEPLGRWLGDPDPAVRRAAAELAAEHPDAELVPRITEAFLAERDPAVREALVGAVVMLAPASTQALRAPVEAKRDPELVRAFGRIVRAAVLRGLESKVRDGRVPGFYDGQFADLWLIAPDVADHLLAIGFDSSIHNVIRVLAVMALHESKRPTLEADLAGLILSEREELFWMQVDFQPWPPTAEQIEKLRQADLSRYARYALAKAGFTRRILQMIREIDDFLAEPEQKKVIQIRAEPNTRLYFQAEFLRDLLFSTGYYYQQFDDYASAEKRYLQVVGSFRESRACENAWYNLACICAITGRKPEALEYLRCAIRSGFTNQKWLLEDGDLTSLREDPEFKALVEQARTGLVDDAGREWLRKLQPFLPAGSTNFFGLDRAAQAAALERGWGLLDDSERRRLFDEAPPETRAWMRSRNFVPIGVPAKGGSER